MMVRVNVLSGSGVFHESKHAVPFRMVMSVGGNAVPEDWSSRYY
jgi:hypothetical protein